MTNRSYKVYTFLDHNEESIGRVIASNHFEAIDKLDQENIDAYTPYYSEHIDQNEAEILYEMHA